MPLKPREMERLLLDNGFVDTGKGKGSHRLYKNHETGKSTTVPFSRNELNKITEKQILKQAGLEK